jgi:hypothetical protein
LIGKEGNELTEMKDILNEQKLYYQKLYTSTNPKIDAESENTFSDRNNEFYVLSNEESQSIENTITINNVTKC